MNYITSKTLHAAGVAITNPKDERILLSILNQVLETSVGLRIAERISSQQQIEFLQLPSADIQSKWLVDRIPELAEIIEDCSQIIIDNLIMNSECCQVIPLYDRRGTRKFQNKKSIVVHFEHVRENNPEANPDGRKESP